ncbi:MAG: prenyltransferase/squalene oxidase repeat-containing protein [Planctomycetaceae bacterium]
MRLCRFAAVVFVVLVLSNRGVPAQEQPPFLRQVEQAVERSLPLLEIASAETAQRRQCFTCHGQALPAVTLIEATKHGFHVDSKNVERQLDHTFAHLKRSQKLYDEGKGTGGQVDTAGWALWGLEAGGRDADEITDSVVSYLIEKQSPSGVWTCSSNRPPSENSDFATTYLALRALDHFGRESHSPQIETAGATAKTWFERAKPVETEDSVFQLLTLPYLNLENRADDRMTQLKDQQRNDGGWAQLPELDSDAYATATVLYALAEAGMDTTNPHYHRGLEFLIRQQQPDGSWHVRSRSKPFQLYFETGYPHGSDQFISMTAACWATLALLNALPQKNLDPIQTDP